MSDREMDAQWAKNLQQEVYHQQQQCAKAGSAYQSAFAEEGDPELESEGSDEARTVRQDKLAGRLILLLSIIGCALSVISSTALGATQLRGNLRANPATLYYPLLFAFSLPPPCGRVGWSGEPSNGEMDSGWSVRVCASAARCAVSGVEQQPSTRIRHNQQQQRVFLTRRKYSPQIRNGVG